MAPSGPAREDDERGRAAAVVARCVRIRFALDLETLTDRAIAIARSAFPGGPWPGCLERLSLDDLYLATACARGEEGAWEECAARFFGFIRGFARRRLRGPGADEVADQVIADLWQRGKMARFEARSTLRTWLGTVVAHAVVNAAKAERPTASLEAAGLRALAPSGPDTTGEAREVEAGASAALTRLMTQALGERGDEDRLLLLLYYEQGLTLDQIAATQRTSKSSLSRRLTRLRDELRSRLDALARSGGSSLEDLRPGLERARFDLDIARLLRPRPLAGEDQGPLV
jgi:RNA polymerase sigma factor (sigma-70 family)